MKLDLNKGTETSMAHGEVKMNSGGIDFDAGSNAGQSASPAHGGKRRKRIRPESIPLRKLIPNLMTAGALAAGLGSVHFAFGASQVLGTSAADQSFKTLLFSKAVGCVAAAFVLDGLDGRTARFLKVTSRFGEKFDSIADFTAFGVAPAFVLYFWQLRSELPSPQLGLAVVVFYILCAAFRLARFTYQARKQKIGAPVSKFFQGMPAPASGAAVLIPVMLELSDTVHWRAPVWITATYAVLLALFMISKLPMISIKGARINRALARPLMIVAGLITFGLIFDLWLTMSVLSGLYLATFPLGVLLHRKQQRTVAAATV